MAQFLPVADLLTTAAGLAKDHWLCTRVELSIQHVNTLAKSDPKVGQALCVAWIISTTSIIFLMGWSLIGTARLFGKCVRSVLRAVRPGRAATVEAATETVLQGGPTAEVHVAKAAKVPHPLVEKNSVKIIEESMMTEKKGGRRVLESPVAKVTKTRRNARKEDVPPSVASPLPRKRL